ncbi:histidine kinase [Xanthovirga aplysinae]|uniref:histidine kinase n=1 Tax=Xanthovirga aplysinae TaxID=2529853 RepID=UPI0012BBA58A|nr:sensor histidine kinase [Xanthovirga aplysinae]MTI33468.1 histidine kinase [Xanthovirga aplysinae]
MKKIFIHHPIYRIICPPIFGTVIYILILLIHNELPALYEYFFSQEVLICVGLSFLVNESLRLLVKILDKYIPWEGNLELRIISQLCFGVGLAILISNTTIAAYFKYIIGFSTNSTELITFNIIYSISSIFYNLSYFSIILLHRKNLEKLNKETLLKEKIDFKIQQFKNTINPGFFYSSLETLIGLVHEDSDFAEEYIDHLASLYRYSLEKKQDELSKLEKELELIEHLIFLLKARYDKNLNFRFNWETLIPGKQMVPGTLQRLVEQIVTENIISKRQPLNILCYLEDDYLILQNKFNERLQPYSSREKFQELEKAYAFYSDQPIIQVKAQKESFIKVPLLQPL